MDQLRAQHGLDASAALSKVESMTDFAEHPAANRLFMRAVRQLRDLPRFAPQVIVQNAGQVNLGKITS